MTQRIARNAIATCAVLLCLVLADTLRSQAQEPQSEPRTIAPGTAALRPDRRILGPDPRTVAPRTVGPQADTPQRALINQYCVGCHNDRLKSGGLALSALNLDDVHQSAEIAEKVIRKLRGGLMPPAGAKRPDGQAAAEFVTWLENKIDAAAAESTPGRVALRRLNRREYGYAIRDLLGLNIDATAWLPDDNVKGNFDNNAAALQVSPNFVDQYVYAARAVALEAIGNPKAPGRDDHLRRRRQHGDLAAAVRRSRHRPAAASPRRDALRHARRLHRRTQLPGGRRIRAHDRRHGARARSAADGVREHGDRAARRQGVLSHDDRRRSRPQGDRSDAGSRGRRDQRTAAQDPLPRHGRAAQARRSPSCIAASPRATSGLARSRSRVARSASRPRMRCRSADRSRSPA